MLGVDLYLKLDIDLAKKLQDMLDKRNKYKPAGTMPETMNSLVIKLLEEATDESN